MNDLFNHMKNEQELDDINKYDPIDQKDKYARDHIDELSHKIIEQIKKIYKEILYILA